MSEGAIRNTGEAAPADDTASQIQSAAFLLMMAIEGQRAQADFGIGPAIIAMSGEPGVGKTTLGRVMQEKYLAEGIGCALLSADGYYQQPVQEGLTVLRENSRGGSVGPTEWDLDELQRDINKFKRGEPVAFKKIDWNTCEVSEEIIKPEDTEVLLVDHLLADFLSPDIMVRLRADPQRIFEQARLRDRAEQRETEGSELLRLVRETERIIIHDVWGTLAHARQLTMEDYANVTVHMRPELMQQDRIRKLAALGNLANIGQASSERVLGKLALLRSGAGTPDSYAELLWVEAALRLLPSGGAQSVRQVIHTAGPHQRIDALSLLVESEVHGLDS